LSIYIKNRAAISSSSSKIQYIFYIQIENFLLFYTHTENKSSNKVQYTFYTSIYKQQCIDAANRGSISCSLSFDSARPRVSILSQHHILQGAAGHHPHVTNRSSISCSLSIDAAQTGEALHERLRPLGRRPPPSSPQSMQDKMEQLESSGRSPDWSASQPPPRPRLALLILLPPQSMQDKMEQLELRGKIRTWTGRAERPRIRARVLVPQLLRMGAGDFSRASGCRRRSWLRRPDVDDEYKMWRSCKF
jgi:hypothetical protein